MVFSNNTAVSGTAVILVQGNIISLAKNSNVKFRNNYATKAGGVFYIDANDYVHIGDTSSNRKCFLNTPVDRSQIQFTFVNNSAGMEGDILYGGQVAFAVDGDWNCLESFKNISTITYYKNDYSLLIGLKRGRWRHCLLTKRTPVHSTSFGCTVCLVRLCKTPCFGEFHRHST